MKEADMVVGWVEEGGKAVIRDEYSTGDFGPHEIDEAAGGRNDILDSGGAFRGGRTILEFRRKLDTGDEKDKPLPTDRDVTLIWAIGKTDDPAKKHGRRGEVKLRLVGGSGRVEVTGGGEGPELWPVHAALMDFAIALLLSGMIIARRKKSDRFWLPRHQLLGIIGALILLISLGTAYYMISFSSGVHFRVPHAFIGAGALSLSLLVPILGFAMLRGPARLPLFRPLHVWLGRVALATLAAGSLTGLFAAGIL
jgi:hypothetical protein